MALKKFATVLTKKTEIITIMLFCKIFKLCLQTMKMRLVHLVLLCSIFLLVVVSFSSQLSQKRIVPRRPDTPIARIQEAPQIEIVQQKKTIEPETVLPAKQQAKPIDFLVIGDYGRQASSRLQHTVDQMRQHCKQETCNFLVSVGDNFYPTGVASLHDVQWQQTFESVFYDLPYPYFVALGNHDYMGNPQAQADYTRFKGLLADKRDSSNTIAKWFLDPKRYYYVDIDTEQNVVPNAQFTNGTKILARLVFMDTTPFRGKHHREVLHGHISPNEMRDTSPQLEWLTSVLSDTRPRWKIVIAHHPMYSWGNHGDCRDIHHLRAMFTKHKVNAMFYGHDHVMQYNYRDNIHYYLSGTGSDLQGSARNYPQYRNNEQAFDAPVFFDAEHNGFLQVRVDEEAIHTKFKSATGHVLHENIIRE